MSRHLGRIAVNEETTTARINKPVKPQKETRLRISQNANQPSGNRARGQTSQGANRPECK